MFRRVSTNVPLTAASNVVANPAFTGAAAAASNPALTFQNPGLISQATPGMINVIGNRQINPGVIVNPGTVFNPGTIFTPGNTGTVTPTNPPGMPDTLSPTELQILLNSLPVAQEGHVITSAHINSLRTAILALAAQIGGGAISPTQLLNFMPAFVPIQQSPTWTLNDGVASAGPKTGGGAASGWLPLQLPDGLTIQAMIVLGDKSGTISSFVVELFKRALDGSDPQSVTTTSLVRAADQFNVTTQTSGNPPVVDNRSTGYFVTADVAFTGDTSQARIFAIQIICSR